MSSVISVPIRRDGADDTTFQIEAHPFTAIEPNFRLYFPLKGGQMFTAVVDAEDLYRAVCAAWELVKPLPLDTLR